MSLKLEGFENVTRTGRDFEIVNNDGEPVGVTITIGPTTDKQHQIAQRKLEDAYSTGKKIPKNARRELLESLKLSRVTGWKWHGEAKKKMGEPDFNMGNLKSLCFDNGETGLAFYEQIKSFIGEYDDFLPDE